MVRCVSAIESFWYALLFAVEQKKLKQGVSIACVCVFVSVCVEHLSICLRLYQKCDVVAFTLSVVYAYALVQHAMSMDHSVTCQYAPLGFFDYVMLHLGVDYSATQHIMLLSLSLSLYLGVKKKKKE